MIAQHGRRTDRDSAGKSTGPRTPSGKSRASRNAIRHGLTSTKFAPSASSERAKQIADQLCANDPFSYRYQVALTIAEAQVFIDRIRLARAAAMERLKAAIATTEEVALTEDTSDYKGVGVAITFDEFEALKRAFAGGKVRVAAQLIRASAKRYEAFIAALSTGQTSLPTWAGAGGPPAWTVRKRPDPMQCFLKTAAELVTLERYERRAIARKQRAVRLFDALYDG